MSLTKFLSTFAIIFMVSDNIAVAKAPMEKKEITITSKNGKVHKFTVEIADNRQKRELGLMFRKKMPENHGMLFLFDEDFFDNNMPVNMWMKDTYIPLDIIFIKENGTIVKIAQGKPQSLDNISSGSSVKAVLELNAGTCKKLGIATNDKLLF